MTHVSSKNKFSCCGVCHVETVALSENHGMCCEQSAHSHGNFRNKSHVLTPRAEGPRSCRMRSSFTHMRRPYVQRNHKTGWAWRVRSVNFSATFDVPLRQLPSPLPPPPPPPPPGVNLCATVWRVHVCRRNMAGRVYLRLFMRWNFRRQRILRDRTNPFDIYDDVELFARFDFGERTLLLLSICLEMSWSTRFREEVRYLRWCKC